jgi:hypothetical protein
VTLRQPLSRPFLRAPAGTAASEAERAPFPLPRDRTSFSLGEPKALRPEVVSDSFPFETELGPHRHGIWGGKLFGSAMPFGMPFSFDTPRRNPEHPRRREGINSPPLPPGDFVSDAVEVAVVNSAQRYGELVADLEPHRSGLGEPEMVGVGGASTANQTRLRRHKLEVRFVAEAARLADGELTFVNFCWSSVGGKRRGSR